MPNRSRRDFLQVAGQLGGALSLSPLLARGLMAESNRIPLINYFHADGIRAVPASPAEELPNLTSGLQWRMLGPFRGGRVDAVCGVIGRPNEFYFGAVNGGVWKSVDAGRVWKPIFDAQPVASIGALAVAPSAPDTVYVGSGESTLRDSVGYGNGMYKSTDAGKSWAHIGLEGTQHIGKIAVDPKNANVVFVAAIGHLYAPNAERGVFRSTDGGKSWQKVLFKNENVGAIDVVIDPTDSRIVFASLWNTRRPPWFTYAPSNGPGGGMYKSTDGGTSWKQLTNGLPVDGMGKSGIAIAASNPKRLYAVVDNLVPEKPAAGGAPAATTAAAAPPPGQGGFFRSDDGGEHWTKMSSDQALWGRGWYFEHVTIDPRNPDIVYVPNVSVSRSMDGGKSWSALRGSPGGDDYHQAWISPDDTNTMIVASDQGAIITRNAKADPSDVTWSSWLNQPTAQIYHLSVDYRFPYWVTGAQQDSGPVAVRSRGKFGELSMREWEPIGAGGESGFTAGDPLNPGIIYGESGNRFDLELNVPVPGTTSPHAPETARTDWTQPLVFSKADHALYYSNQFVFRTTDGAKTWMQISPDLTRPDPGVPAALDTASGSNKRRGVVYTIAPSPVQAPVIWVGTDDGLVHVTADHGANWQNVTPPGVTSWSRVTTMEASHFDVAGAYASVDRHQLQDFTPHIYRTRDSGKTWQRIVNGLPNDGYVHVIREDPVRKGLLFAGTERGVFVSFDDGDNWQSLQINLPVTSNRDFEIYGNDLIVATHGRGFWVIDDISALRQFNATVRNADAYLFKPADAINFIQGDDNGTPLQKDEAQALNPPTGAVIDYYLKNPVSGAVTITILDTNGATVHEFSSTGTAAVRGRRGGRGGVGIPNASALWNTPAQPLSALAGLHRVVWRTAAVSGQNGDGQNTAPTPAFLGTFTAKLTVNGMSYTQTFTVKPDPRVRSR